MDKKEQGKQKHDLFAKQSPHSSPGIHIGLIESVTADLRAMTAFVQNLLIYDVAAKPFYGIDLNDDRAQDIHIRQVDQILQRLTEIGSPQLLSERQPQHRMAARCGTFALLLLALLRHHGIPARSRAGFADYFSSATFEDHWVVEYWDADCKTWRYADPMFDAVWQQRLGIQHDILNVPKAKFLTAAEVWKRCRLREMDPDRVGISHANLYGLFFIAGSLIRDIAAFCRVEMLPWDVWGAQPRPDDALDPEKLAYFDDLAEHMLSADSNPVLIERLYATDQRLTVPTHVFNALRNRTEPARLPQEQDQHDDDTDQHQHRYT
ncbi:transglutaminase domain-containing protein [Peteryoungia desertarenae]|uniref:Transglutaminase domain-containing protein n=1 Tax=Peteryoungia desertarenae TaxID=1813451 RepID=A0ABX6QNW2_9HYPH|nr:transglutaminase domain-containing protein [Peteryoungia desertarenae]QLF69930.1 transglutaminase domain-containing protein [Peteryoungia desertarenae]